MDWNVTSTLVIHECGQCGMLFAMPKSFQEARKEDGGTFCCPAGHRRVYTGGIKETWEKEKNAALEKERKAKKAAKEAIKVARQALKDKQEAEAQAGIASRAGDGLSSLADEPVRRRGWEAIENEPE